VQKCHVVFVNKQYFLLESPLHLTVAGFFNLFF
jgi:hypothetical protein